MITDILRMVDDLKKGTLLTLKQVCAALELPYSTVMRWKGRRARLQPVLRRPGPAKVAPLNTAALEAELHGLKHGRKRSLGTTSVYQRHALSVSRRDFYSMVKQARFDANAAYARNMKRISWNAPGVVWGVDDTLYGYDRDGRKIFLHQLQDMASIYKFGPVVGDQVHSEEAAGYLHHLFVTHGAPLFLKRDCASNLNGAMVNEVLDAHMVLPLNSPPQYPPYNGCIERAQKDLKSAMRTKLATKPYCPVYHLEAYASASAHDLNHKARPSLKGQNACQVFNNRKNEYKFTRHQRRAIYDLIISYAERILSQMRDRSRKSIDSAWRTAVETWLRWKGYITVSINGKVLPTLNPILSHY
jgi:hypothetical protein